MATYSEIKGFTIQSLASDPLTSLVAGGAWASAPSLNTAKQRGMCAGIQTAAIAAGGYQAEDTVETYNGSTWSEENDMLEGRDYGGNHFGTSTAALYVSGANGSPWPNVMQNVEEWNGTSWTEGTNVLTARRNAMGAGTTTAAVTGGGYIGPPITANTEKYDGTSWTESGDLNTARTYVGSAGTTSTAALCIGGEDPSPGQSALVEDFDGTSWSAKAALNTAGTSMGGAGTNTSALAFGGAPSFKTKTEYYDGTSWTEIADLATGVEGAFGTGTTSLALSAGGATPSIVTSTEVFDAATSGTIVQEGQVWYNTTSAVLKSFGMQGTGAWASAPALNTPRADGGAAGGTVTAALYNGGDPTPGVITEQYNGTAWTEVGDSSTPRTANGTSWNGTSTACLMARGAPGPITSAAESWNGTSWSALTAVPTAARLSMGAGTSTAAVTAGGYYPSNVAVATTFEYNAPTWSTTNNLNEAKALVAGAGSQTAAIAIGGWKEPGLTLNIEEYDGSCWAEAANLNTARDGVGVSGAQGAQTAAVAFGGRDNRPTGSNQSALTEQWDGTSWTASGELASARGTLGGCGQDGNVALAFGGGSPPSPPTGTLVEEFSIPDAIKTFTAT